MTDNYSTNRVIIQISRIDENSKNYESFQNLRIGEIPEFNKETIPESKKMPISGTDEKNSEFNKEVVITVSAGFPNTRGPLRRHLSHTPEGVSG